VSGAGAEAVPPPARRPSIAAHVDRALVRLTSLRATVTQGPRLSAEIDAIIDELNRLAQHAGRARGDARARIVEELAALDRRMMTAAQGEIDPAAAAALRQEAEAELAGFGSRMAPEVRSRATGAAFERLVRESLRLPVLSYE
jgi:hypothetical protein